MRTNTVVESINSPAFERYSRPTCTQATHSLHMADPRAQFAACFPCVCVSARLWALAEPLVLFIVSQGGTYGSHAPGRKVQQIPVSSLLPFYSYPLIM